MVQINLSLLFVASIASIVPTLAHPLARREDIDIVGSAFSRRFYGGPSAVIARDVDFDLEQREPSWDAVLHPIRTWKEHRRVKDTEESAKLRAEADIKQEHANDLERREPSWDAVLHPVRTWKEHRRVEDITKAAKLKAEADIKQEHANDLERREPSWDAVLHPVRTWKEHRRVKEVTAAAKARAQADIKQQHADADSLYGGSNQRREYINEVLVERSFDDFDLEARDFEEEY